MSRSEYNNNFVREKRDRINLIIPKGDKSKLIDALRDMHGGKSVNGFLTDYISKTIEAHERIANAAREPSPEASKQEPQEAIAGHGDMVTVTNKQAAYLLGMNPRSMSKLVKEGHLARPPGNNKLVMLHSVIERAEQRGIDISGKLAGLT